MRDDGPPIILWCYSSTAQFANLLCNSVWRQHYFLLKKELFKMQTTWPGLKRSLLFPSGHLKSHMWNEKRWWNTYHQNIWFLFKTCGGSDVALAFFLLFFPNFPLCDADGAVGDAGDRDSCCRGRARPVPALLYQTSGLVQYHRKLRALFRDYMHPMEGAFHVLEAWLKKTALRDSSVYCNLHKTGSSWGFPY